MINKKVYQIAETSTDGMHAGTKATSDIKNILDDNGVNTLIIRTPEYSKNILKKFIRQLKYLKQWRQLYKSIKDESILVLQHPFYLRQLGRYKTLSKLKNLKKVKIISIVHDVGQLRGLFNDKYNQAEFNQMIKLADVLIVHNEIMKNWFIEQGISSDKLFVLEIFDYLTDKDLVTSGTFEEVVSIAGNLSKEKSPYIYKLKGIENLNITLLGINYKGDDYADNIKYRGAFPADEVPFQINDGFGLVWDGDSIESCTGNTGNYLRYNNPHKLSLYLSSGLPVIVWNESAEAKFVLDNKLGFTVSSLREIPDIIQSMSIDEYLSYRKNAINVGNKLQRGYYTKKAMASAITFLSIE